MKQEEQPYVAEMPSVTVEKIHPDERECVRSLRVHPYQSSFVASNEDSLEEADDNPACVPLIIRAGSEPVGFAMYALDEDDGNYWIYRLMIDARFQGKGYGRTALVQILKMLGEQSGCSCVVLGVKPGNVSARDLYESVGFRATGDIIDDEIVLKYEF